MYAIKEAKENYVRKKLAIPKKERIVVYTLLCTIICLYN